MRRLVHHRPPDTRRHDLLFPGALFAGMVFGEAVDATLRQETVQSPSVGTPEEVDALIARARMAGVSHVRDASVPPWGGRAGAFADPDGQTWAILSFG